MKYGALVGAKIGAFFGGVGAGPGALIGGILGAFLGPGMFKGILNGIKSMFGFKVDKDEEEEGHGGEIVMYEPIYMFIIWLYIYFLNIVFFLEKCQFIFVLNVLMHYY